jgi:opacity protein-like surface antigen
VQARLPFVQPLLEAAEGHPKWPPSQNWRSEMFLRGLSMALVITALGSGIAQAQEAGEAGFYVRGYAGASTLSDANVTVGALKASGKYNGDLITGGAVGYDYEGPWRAEVEYTYRSSTFKAVPATFASAGDYASTAIMLNGLYSFGQLGVAKPYVGAGVGFTREVDFDLKNGAAAGSFSASGDFAFQGILGVDVPFADKWSGFGEVRLFTINNPTLKGNGKTLKADYQTVDLLVGITRRF